MGNEGVCIVVDCGVSSVFPANMSFFAMSFLAIVPSPTTGYRGLHFKQDCKYKETGVYYGGTKHFCCRGRSFIEYVAFSRSYAGYYCGGGDAGNGLAG